MKKPTCKFYFIGVSLITLWLSAVATSIWKFGYTDYAKKSNCIIVLGAAVDGDKPSPVFRERINHAIALYSSGFANRIIFTGGFGDGETYSESEVGQNYAINLGIPATSILIETKSQTTFQNLSQAKQLMDTHQLKSAIIVSDPLHLKRASLMTDSLALPSTTSPTPTSRYRSFKTQMSFLLREVFFLHHFLIFRQ